MSSMIPEFLPEDIDDLETITNQVHGEEIEAILQLKDTDGNVVAQIPSIELDPEKFERGEILTEEALHEIGQNYGYVWIYLRPLDSPQPDYDMPMKVVAYNSDQIAFVGNNFAFGYNFTGNNMCLCAATNNPDYVKKGDDGKDIPSEYIVYGTKPV